jgi:hypothetical protein
MESLLEPAARERMGRAARELALEHTFERNVDEFLTLYDDVIRLKRAAQ